MFLTDTQLLIKYSMESAPFLLSLRFAFCCTCLAFSYGEYASTGEPLHIRKLKQTLFSKHNNIATINRCEVGTTNIRV